MNKNDNNAFTIVTLLPVLADILEDLEFKYEAKYRGQAIVNAIRKFDNFIMKNAPIDVVEEQIEIQQAFRQWLNENFK